MQGRVKETLHRIVYTARMMSWAIDPRSYDTPPPLPIVKPVFLLGTQGGGLTLLARMFQRHPEVISAAGNCDYWTAANELQNVYGPIVPFDLTGLRYKAPHHPLLSAPRSWTFATKDLLPLYRRTAASPAVADALKNVVRLSAQRHAKDRANFRFMDKSQVFSVRAGMLHDIFPDAKFILVPREPYVSVYRAATGKAGDMKRLENAIPYEERIRLCAEHYGNSMRAVFEDADRRGFALHVLPFETLLRQPEKSLREACAFAELSYSDDMLPSPAHKMPLGTRFLDRWHPIRENVNDGYDGKIDGFIVKTVNEYAGDVIDRLGYAKK